MHVTAVSQSSLAPTVCRLMDVIKSLYISLNKNGKPTRAWI